MAEEPRFNFPGSACIGHEGSARGGASQLSFASPAGLDSGGWEWMEDRRLVRAVPRGCTESRDGCTMTDNGSSHPYRLTPLMPVVPDSYHCCGWGTLTPRADQKGSTSRFLLPQRVSQSTRTGTSMDASYLLFASASGGVDTRQLSRHWHAPCAMCHTCAMPQPLSTYTLYECRTCTRTSVLAVRCYGALISLDRICAVQPCSIWLGARLGQAEPEEWDVGSGRTGMGTGIGSHGVCVQPNKGCRPGTKRSWANGRPLAGYPDSGATRAGNARGPQLGNHANSIRPARTDSRLALTLAIRCPQFS